MEDNISKFDNTSKKLFSYIATVLYRLQSLILFVIGVYIGKRSVFCESTGELSLLVTTGLVLIVFIKVFYVGTRLPNTKRFTYTDEMGNRCIRSEDLPEIIDYLYEQEELHGNR